MKASAMKHTNKTSFLSSALSLINGSAWMKRTIAFSKRWNGDVLYCLLEQNAFAIFCTFFRLSLLGMNPIVRRV